MSKKALALFFSFFFLFSSLAESEEPKPSAFSFIGEGGGRASNHIINAALLLEGSLYKAEGFYFLGGSGKIYGASISNRKDIPMALTWLSNGRRRFQAFSIAGSITSQWALGAGLRNHNESEKPFSLKPPFSPHIGWFYKMSRFLSLGLSFDRVDEKLTYTISSFYFFEKIFELQGLIRLKEKDRHFMALAEWHTEDQFSVRLGFSWPENFYRAGISFTGGSLIFDYDYLQERGHLFTVRIHTRG